MPCTLQPTPPTLERDRTALKQLASAVSDPKSTLLQLDLAFRAYNHAKPDALRNPTLVLQCAQRGAALTHRKDPYWLLNLAQAYRTTGNAPLAATAATEGLALLPADPANQTFRLRKLLTAQTSPR